MLVADLVTLAHGGNKLFVVLAASRRFNAAATLSVAAGPRSVGVSSGAAWRVLRSETFIGLLFVVG
jgi:hypothetical protein